MNTTYRVKQMQLSTDKLVDGRIPAHTECPFRTQCAFAIRDACSHKGKDHNVPFSCGAARAYELVNRNSADHN